MKVYHTLTRHDENKDGEWNGFTGRINLEMIQKCGFPEPAEDTLIGICGPKHFKENILNEILIPQGYVSGEMTN